MVRDSLQLLCRDTQHNVVLLTQGRVHPGCAHVETVGGAGSTRPPLGTEGSSSHQVEVGRGVCAWGLGL